MNLKFDDDIALNLTGIPSCPSSELTGKNISAAYEQCGPGADGNPASEGNAFLSPAGNVSGLGSTVPPANLIACTMIFKGATNNTLTIYARAPVATRRPGATTRRPTPGARRRCCSRARLTHQPAASPYDWTLNVPNTHTANPSLDDFYATVTRGAAFRARCPRWGSPPQDAGDLGLHRCRRCERLARRDGSVPVAEPDS